MATTHIEEQPRVIIPRASRGNEILAILLLAVGALLALCLVSAAFYPNDPSWNSAGQGETHNWAGSIGANVAATAFQFIGLASFLLPLLLFAAAFSSWLLKQKLFQALSPKGMGMFFALSLSGHSLILFSYAS